MARYMKINGALVKLPKSFRDLKGQTFGRMTAIRCVGFNPPSHTTYPGQAIWEWRCEACGSITRKEMARIVHTRVKSVTCGCECSQG